MKDETQTRDKTPARLKPMSDHAEGALTDVSLRALLSRLVRGGSLRRDEAENFLDALLDGEASYAQIGAALVALAVKGETVEELTGMATAMRARAVRLQCRHKHFIDTAGTSSSHAKLSAFLGAPAPTECWSGIYRRKRLTTSLPRSRKINSTASFLPRPPRRMNVSG